MINNSVKNSNRDKQELGIYIHIPFCVRKCSYCDFLSAPSSTEIMSEYVTAMGKEMRIHGEHVQKHRIKTIFIGGGTPSLLEPNDMERLLRQLHNNFPLEKEIEFTIECNPGTLTREKLKVYKENGINRISLGLQSTENAELLVLGRIHTYEEFLKTYEMIRTEGFSNINIDLMSGLPNQTVTSWRKTLQKSIELQPEHISAYGLIIEEGTKFYEQKLDLPSEEAEREMVYATKELLQEAGYLQYEISNYAKPGFACQHNISYWIRKNYLGIGLGAASLMDNVRYHNCNTLSTYIEHADSLKEIQVDRTILSKNDQMEEYMFLGLRMIEGISVKSFEDTFQCSYEEIYGEITKELVKKKLLVFRDNRISLSQKGLDLSNYVMAEFLF